MRDTSLEKTRWIQVLKTGVILMLSFAVWTFFPLFTMWMADGYFSISGDLQYNPDGSIGGTKTSIPALGEFLYISLNCGIFVGIGGALFIIKTYKHPFSLYQEKLKEARMSNSQLLADGEWAVRGAEIQDGPWPSVIQEAKEKAIEAGKTLEKKLKGKPLAPIRVADAPFPYSFENRGIFIQGSAGSGKSQVIKQMIYDIRNRGGRDKLIIYDRKPEYLPIFYKKGDIIICPADRRHTPWDLFKEIKTELDVGGVIASLIPETAGGGEGNQRFWDSSARDVMKAVLLYLTDQYKEGRLEREPSNKELVEFLFKKSSDIREFYLALKENPASAHFAKTLAPAEKPNNMSNIPSSVMATLQSYISSFTRPEVSERGWFSIKEWLVNPETEGQAIFLVNPAKYSSDYQSFFTVVLDIAMREMISIPNDINRRVWFFADEFGSLFKLDSVVRLLAEGRSKGACTVLGTQDQAQIKQKYKDDVETLINNCNSKVIARVTSKDEAKYMSELIGELEVEKESAKTDYGFDKDKGFSVSLHDSSAGGERKTKAAVMPAEISNLEDLTYFCKFGDRKWFKSKMEYYPWSKHEFFPDFLQRPSEFFSSNKLLESETSF